MAQRKKGFFARSRSQLHHRHLRRPSRTPSLYATQTLRMALISADVFACPDNVFFFDRLDWVWGLVAWQWIQISILFAQERFGSAFL